MNTLELIAALLGALSVGLLVVRNVWAFPIGIAMVLLYTVVFYQAKYYADMCLQVAYVVMQIQGWYEWTRGDRGVGDKITVRRLVPFQWVWLLLAVGGGTAFIGLALQRFTDASLPWLDAFTTSVSLVAQWCLNKKYLENWALWIFVDIIYLYQYSYKALYFTTALYAVFLGLAIAGHVAWRKAVPNYFLGK